MSDGLLLWLERIRWSVRTVRQPVVPARLRVGGVWSPKVLVLDPSGSHVDLHWVVCLVVLVAEIVFANELARLRVIHVCDLTPGTHESVTPDVSESSVEGNRHGWRVWSCSVLCSLPLPCRCSAISVPNLSEPCTCFFYLCSPAFPSCYQREHVKENW